MVSANGARRTGRRGGVVRDPVITEAALVDGAAPGAGDARTVAVVVEAGSVDTSPPALSLRGLSKTFGAQHAPARHALERLVYDISPTALVASLVESERAAVALARALADVADVPLLVLGEPTASLPRPEAERLFAAIRRVAAAGTAVLFISHHLDEVLRLANHVTVLRDGFRVATTHVGDLSQDLLIEMMLGRQLL